jgi:lipid-A-disaccharide synthase
MNTTHLKIAVIAGEESGDILGADLVVALREHLEFDVIGVGGKHLAAQGQATLFDPSEIALMGVAAILAKLPKLIGLIKKTADYIIQSNPDCLVIIDSPEFCHRVAKRVRKANPAIPIINYVCPSVWAWRPGRAKDMKAYVDHVLAILPFEPKVLADLGGPMGTYVGHRAVVDDAFIQASETQTALEPARFEKDNTRLLVLPGSRRSEVRRTMAHLADTVGVLNERGHALTLWLPTVPHVEAEVRRLSQSWAIQPEITTNAARKMEMFGNADAALAASGTVTLELALSGVPTVAIYDFDALARIWVYWLFRGWTASLPNLIADEPIVPEHYNEHIFPGMLARELERLLTPSLARRAQLAGFAKIRSNMQTSVPPSAKAAEVVLQLIQSRIQA